MRMTYSESLKLLKCCWNVTQGPARDEGVNYRLYPKRYSKIPTGIPWFQSSWCSSPQVSWDKTLKCFVASLLLKCSLNYALWNGSSKQVSFFHHHFFCWLSSILSLWMCACPTKGHWPWSKSWVQIMMSRFNSVQMLKIIILASSVNIELIV